MNTDGQNRNVGGMAGANTGDVDAVAAATAVSAIGSSENVNNNSSNGKAGGGGNEGKTNASAVDDSLVDPELNQQSTDERAKAEDNDDDDDDQINQIEDDNDNIVAAAAAAAASNDMNYLANMHAVENHMQNVLGNAGAQGGAGPDGPGPGASVGGHGMLHANAQGAPRKDIEMGGSGHDANDADYNDDGDDDDDDDDNKLSSKTAIDAVVESSKVKKSVSNTKRAAQNRAAQRAFRQRRKTRIEQLENVELLYKAALQDVERLQAENDALKKKLTEINSK
ncbi:hypothetical protein PICMEDRAFT_12147 [Pichia membranifaciens NRRL Y-2026]|uniref:BZIP domain-containing protein n=1 Tax=Pichia membranifaciens NRRL Y-2026 TaxID=763406 RepID=A0A1E3NJD7_9ASCO|nr:hypothetical protein PICMEDRAFT_12147 [Pichia membranifaciens NRRL Y-2026]ODQ45688.1 hypothetical protein PICMEDRAFT_12147 [Pichia membranifaciens NRRL Y-2026]